MSPSLRTRDRLLTDVERSLGRVVDRGITGLFLVFFLDSEYYSSEKYETLPFVLVCSWRWVDRGA